MMEERSAVGKVTLFFQSDRFDQLEAQLCDPCEAVLRAMLLLNH
jgi:hypothetical protein